MPGEFDIIERYFRRPGVVEGVPVGIGDDAAILSPHGDIAVAVDTLVEGVHFPSGFSAHSTGHRALAVNLSDLAAMGARPLWATLALCLPATDENWLDDFAAGFFELASRFGVSLVGGDTTGGRLTVSITLIGKAAEKHLLRSGAAPGDCIVVTGSLGDAAAGLRLLQSRPAAANGGNESAGEAAAELVQRFAYPTPRVEFGLAMAGLASAAIDVSDGLLADLGHVLRQSHCGAELDPEALPLSNSLLTVESRSVAERLALSGGDDYELCLAIPRENLDKAQAVADRTETPITRIGQIVAGSGIVACRGDERQPLEAAGYEHFGR